MNVDVRLGQNHDDIASEYLCPDDSFEDHLSLVQTSSSPINWTNDKIISLDPNHQLFTWFVSLSSKEFSCKYLIHPISKLHCCMISGCYLPWNYKPRDIMNEKSQ